MCSRNDVSAGPNPATEARSLTRPHESAPDIKAARSSRAIVALLPNSLPTNKFMDICRVKTRRLAGIRTAGGRILGLLPLWFALLPLPANSGEKSGEAWPTAVQARYSLRYNGIGVGRLDVKTTTTGNSYSISGTSKVSALFGAISWTGSSTVSGTIEGGAPTPATYAFDWHLNKKSGIVQMGFKNHVAAEVAVNPPAKIRPDTVPLTPAHKAGAFDPMSAILVLTRADNSRPPCDRRAGIFDGKQRYDIVFAPKRQIRLPHPSGGAASEIGYVCQVTYEPIAGHRANEDTKSYVANKDVEIVLRRIPNSDMLIPYSVTIPTSWGTGTMVTERIDIVSATAGKVALTD